MVNSERNLFHSQINPTHTPPFQAPLAVLFERDLQIMTTKMALLSLDMAPLPPLVDFPSGPNRLVKPKKSGRNLKSVGCVKRPDCNMGFDTYIALFSHIGIHQDKGSEVDQNPSINKPNRFLLRKQTGGWTVTKNQSPRELLDRKVVEEVIPTSIVIDKSKLNGGCSNSGGEVKCPVCGEGFKSDKAVFGHMRIHTNKDSKGCFKKPSVEKPKTKARPGPDLSKLITSWTVTKKRSPREEADSKVPVQVAASILLEMSNSARNGESLGSRTVESAPSEDSDNVAAATLIDMRNLILNVESRKRKTMPEYAQLENKKPKIEELVPSEDKNKHVCLTCNKTFPSRQALGGHCSSHSMQRKKAGSLESALLQKGDLKNNVKRKCKSGPHICEICQKAYQTGQELGGHKRAHYKKSEPA